MATWGKWTRFPMRRCAGFKKNERKPWKQKGWVSSPDHNSEFVAAMEQVLEVYKRPYDPMRPVVCMDESSKQLIVETRHPLPMVPDRKARFNYEYRRCGVYSVFIATQPLAGNRMVQVLPTRTKIQWAHFLNRIAERWPQAERITLAGDNLNTHMPGVFMRRFRPNRKKTVGPV